MARHVRCMRYTINVHKGWLEYVKGEDHLGNLGLWWEDVINMVLK